MENLAENIEEVHKAEIVTQKKDKKDSTQEIDKHKLTSNEVNLLEEGKTSIKELIQKRTQYETAAKAELKKLTGETLITLKEYRDINEEIKETQSPEKMKEILNKIKEIPKQKEEESKNEEEESKELNPDDPKLLKLEKQFNKICDENSDLIGLKQVPGFKAWFKEQRQRHPSIKYLKEVIKKLEGKEITDKDGLAPRREEFSRLNAIFQRYKIPSPLKSKYIENEGLSERVQYRKNAEEFEDIIHKAKDTPFYTNKVVDKLMKDILLAKDPNEQQKNISLAKKVTKKESEEFIRFNEKIRIGDTTIRKISPASVDTILQYYKNSHNLNERLSLATHWEKAVESEANMAKELEKIYKDDPKGLKLALKSFENLSYIDKQNSLKEHKKLVESTKNKEEIHKKLIIKAAHSEIDKAAGKNILAKSTQKKYKEWFSNDKNFRNSETKEAGDLKELEKSYEILISPIPNGEYKNLSAYEIKRERFKNELKELQDINLSIKKEEIKKWQEKYDKEGWTNRKKVYKDMKKEVEKHKKEQAKKRELEEKADIKKEDKEKAQEKNPKLEETIKSATELLKDSQAQEALKVLLAYNEVDPDNPKILFWIKTAGEYMKEFGSGKKLEKSAEKQAEEEVKKTIESDENIKDEIEEQNIIALNLEGTKLSEERHQRKISAQDRAKKESIQNTKDGSLEQDLTKDFYEKTDEEHILNKEGTGEKITEIQFSDADMTKEKKQELREKTKHEQSKLIDKKGFVTKLKDESGEQISTDEATQAQEKELDNLEEKIAEKATERTKIKSEKEEKSAGIFDLNMRIAAKRKASEIVGEKIHEKLE